jgi:membrane protein
MPAFSTAKQQVDSRCRAYLAEFAHTFDTYYAGLASGMIALSFLYVTAAAFVYGGELNASVARARDRKKRSVDLHAEDTLVP